MQLMYGICMRIRNKNFKNIAKLFHIQAYFVSTYPKHYLNSEVSTLSDFCLA